MCIVASEYCQDTHYHGLDCNEDNQRQKEPHTGTLSIAALILYKTASCSGDSRRPRDAAPTTTAQRRADDSGEAESRPRRWQGALAAVASAVIGATAVVVIQVGCRPQRCPMQWHAAAKRVLPSAGVNLNVICGWQLHLSE